MKKLKLNKKAKDKGSTERFGYQWKKYNWIVPEYEGQFLKWVFPLKKTDFKEKKILDAGCGVGRNSFWSLKYGSKKVVGFDFDERTVGVAKRNLKDFKNASVFYKSVYDLTYKNEFDIAFSIGVIHHLEHPEKAIEKLVQSVRKGGKVLIWVYGHEGNEWIVKYINPIRKMTSKLPLFATYAISSVFTAILYPYLKLFRQKHPYMKQISGFKFWHVQNIVFDQLIPKIANYWKKEEALNLFEGKGLKDIKIYKVNNNSWTVIGTKR